MNSTTNKTLRHIVLVEDLGSELSHTGRLLDLSNVHIVHSCLYKGIHAAQTAIVVDTESKVGLKQFVKCPNGTHGLAGQGLLVEDYVVGMDLTLPGPNCEQIWLLALLDAIKVLLNAGSCLKMTSNTTIRSL